MTPYLVHVLCRSLRTDKLGCGTYAWIRASNLNFLWYVSPYSTARHCMQVIFLLSSPIWESACFSIISYLWRHLWDEGFDRIFGLPPCGRGWGTAPGLFSRRLRLGLGSMMPVSRGHLFWGRRDPVCNKKELTWFFAIDSGSTVKHFRIYTASYVLTI